MEASTITQRCCGIPKAWPPLGVFTCPVCGEGVKLRKHPSAHLPHTRQIWTPARHYALDQYCHSCHTWLGSVQQVPYHLKRHDSCLRKVLYLFPPFTTAEIRQVEHAETTRERSLRQAQWAAFRYSSQTAAFYRPLTEQESEISEDVPLTSLRAHRPDAERVAWIENHILARSQRGDLQFLAAKTMQLFHLEFIILGGATFRGLDSARLDKTTQLYCPLGPFKAPLRTHSGPNELIKFLYMGRGLLIVGAG